LPKVTSDSATHSIVVEAGGEKTHITFHPDSSGRTKLRISRGDEVLLSEK
jgi:hypothetical protein